MKRKVIQHLNPTWANRANFIIGCSFSPPSSDFDEAWEQLWVEKKSDQIFVICCIPFFVHNLSLGDEVKTDKDFMIIEVIRPSGFITYRVWLGDSPNQGIREKLTLELSQRKCYHEWFSQNLLAISCEERISQTIADYLNQMEIDGSIIYETGKNSDDKS